MRAYATGGSRLQTDSIGCSKYFITRWVVAALMIRENGVMKLVSSERDARLMVAFIATGEWREIDCLRSTAKRLYGGAILLGLSLHGAGLKTRRREWVYAA